MRCSGVAGSGLPCHPRVLQGCRERTLDSSQCRIGFQTESDCVTMQHNVPCVDSHRSVDHCADQLCKRNLLFRLCFWSYYDSASHNFENHYIPISIFYSKVIFITGYTEV